MEYHFDQKFFKKVLPDLLPPTQIPILKHNKIFVGNTGYIDGIIPTDLSHPVMRGVDHLGRPYLVLSDNNWVQTFFQRYTEDQTVWAYGTFRIGFLHSSGNLLEQPRNLKKIKRKIIHLLK